MRIDLEVLNSVDHIITTTSTSDSECVSVQRKRENQRMSMRIDLGLEEKEREQGRQKEYSDRKVNRPRDDLFSTASAVSSSYHVQPSIRSARRVEASIAVWYAALHARALLQVAQLALQIPMRLVHVAQLTHHRLQHRCRHRIEEL